MEDGEIDKVNYDEYNCPKCNWEKENCVCGYCKDCEHDPCVCDICDDCHNHIDDCECEKEDDGRCLEITLLGKEIGKAEEFDASGQGFHFYNVIINPNVFTWPIPIGCDLYMDAYTGEFNFTMDTDHKLFESYKELSTVFKPVFNDNNDLLYLSYDPQLNLEYFNGTRVS